MFKVNNRNTRTRCEVWSKLIIKTPKRRYFTPCSSVFIVNFEQVLMVSKVQDEFHHFFCFDPEKGLGNSGESQDYFVSFPIVNL